MFINVESKKIFNDAGIEKVFKSAEKLALDRFDMTQNLRKNIQLRTEEKRLFKQYYTKLNPQNSIITPKEIKIEMRLKSALSHAAKLKTQLATQNIGIAPTKQKPKPQTNRQQSHIQIQENGVFQHDIDPLLLSIQKLQLQSLDKNETKKKIVDPNSEYLTHKKLQQDLEDTYKQKMYGIGGISTEEMKRKFLKGYNPKEDPLFPNMESEYPFNRFRQTIANIFKHACQIKEQRTQLEMFKTPLVYQPITLDNEWPVPLDLILQRYNLHNQHILTSYIVKGRNKQDVKEEQAVIGRILTDIKKLTENECNTFIQELLDNQMLNYDNKIDRKIIQYYDDTHQYTYPSVLRPDKFYSALLWQRQQITESTQADVKRYMEQLKICVYKDIFVIFPKLNLYKESRRQIPELVEQYLQHFEVHKLAFLENQLLEKVFLQSLNQISQDFQPHGQVTLQESLACINNKIKTKTDKERFFDELNALLDEQSGIGSYLMKQIKEQLELILYQNNKLIQKHQEHNKVLEKYQSSKLKSTRFNNHLLKGHNSIELQFNDKLNLGQKMSLVASNVQAQNYFSNPVANTYFEVLSTKVDKNHWSQIPASQVIQQFSENHKEDSFYQEEQLLSKTSIEVQNTKNSLTSKMNTKELSLHPTYQLQQKKINHEFTNMILPVVLFCTQYAAIKCAEEIYLFQLNSQVGQMMLQRFYSVLKNLSEPCKIAFQTIQNLL